MDQRDGTNRDLLVGLLALQNGLVEQNVLILAFAPGPVIGPGRSPRSCGSRCDRRRRTSLARRACRQAPRSPRRRPREEPRGDGSRPFDPSSLAEIGDPDIEATLGHVGSNLGSTNDDPMPTAPAAMPSARHFDGQRFRVLRPHARGGLGAVFMALDAELNREVALKEILDHHADDPTSRTRFVLEAEITGGWTPGDRAGLRPGELRRRPAPLRRGDPGDSLKETIAAFHADETLKDDVERWTADEPVTACASLWCVGRGDGRGSCTTVTAATAACAMAVVSADGLAGGPGPCERRAQGRQHSPRTLQPGRGQGQRRPEGGQRARASPGPRWPRKRSGRFTPASAKTCS